MVEDAVDDDAHAAGVGVGDEVEEEAVGGGPNPRGRVFGFVGGGECGEVT